MQIFKFKILKPLPEFGYLNVTEENLTKVEFKTI